MASLLSMCIYAVQSERSAYPSSKPRTRDWDKLEAQVKKEVCQLPFPLPPSLWDNLSLILTLCTCLCVHQQNIFMSAKSANYGNVFADMIVFLLMWVTFLTLRWCVCLNSLTAVRVDIVGMLRDGCSVCINLKYSGF